MHDFSDLNPIQSSHSLYDSRQEMLEDVLKHRQFLHHRQLRYLSGVHTGNVLKMRYVLQPFSFLFLLAGVDQFHIILETLDTEEATYLWHFEKRVPLLPAKLKQIEQHLDIIRNHGRQAFLNSAPANFSRVHHDYANEQKGFILWKSNLEERLI